MSEHALGPGSPGDHQVRIGEPPESQVFRRRFVWWLWVAFSALMLVGGVRNLLTGSPAAPLGVSLVFVIVGSVAPLLALLNAFRQLRGTWWSRRFRCFHCGYEMRAARSWTCPECGKDSYQS